MAFRILNQAPAYLLPDGSVNAGGKLWTYETDLSTEKDTWSDADLTTLNSNPVVMDAAGRTLTDVWGDGEYGVVMTDADDQVIWTRNNVRADAGADQAIPALVDGQFLTNDGSDLLWSAILQVPDPTGLANYYLVSDGTGTPIWQQIPETPEPEEPEIVVGAASFRAGVSTDETKFLIQRGTGTAPATGTVNTSLAVVFATEYDDTPTVHVTPTSDSNAGGPMVPELSALSSTGFTVLLTIAAGDLDNAKVLNSVPFCWTAFGNVEVPAEP